MENDATKVTIMDTVLTPLTHLLNYTSMQMQLHTNTLLLPGVQGKGSRKNDIDNIAFIANQFYTII